MSRKIILIYKEIEKEISTPENYKMLCDSFLNEFNENDIKNFYFFYKDDEEDEIQISEDCDFSEINDNKIYISKLDIDEGRLSIDRYNSKSFHEKSNNEFTAKLEEVTNLISKRDENNDNDDGNNNDDNSDDKSSSSSFYQENKSKSWINIYNIIN